jgi:hypothetical protein
LPSTWATACSLISATRRRTSTTPSVPFNPHLPCTCPDRGSAETHDCCGSPPEGEDRDRLIGAGAAQEQAVVGETPNLATRLQALAELGAVVIASSTWKLAVCSRSRASQRMWPHSAESRFEALRATTTPLIGGDEEVDLLIQRWAQAKAANGCIVLISGEPVSANRASLKRF